MSTLTYQCLSCCHSAHESFLTHFGQGSGLDVKEEDAAAAATGAQDEDAAAAAECAGDEDAAAAPPL